MRKSIPFDLETDPSGRWAVVLEDEPKGVAVRVIEAANKQTSAVLSPRDYLPSEFDFPISEWSANSESLAVATLKGLWVWKPGERAFRNAATWSWQVKEIVVPRIKWSPDASWILRYVKFGPLKGQREARFECVEVETGRVVPAEVSFPNVTMAEWHDDDLAFSICVIVDQRRGLYKTVYVDARTGRKLQEFD